MSYCLNPACPQPHQGSEATEQCPACGLDLRLRSRFFALKPIGQGGFGRTFLAIDLAIDAADPLQSRCVIKQFFPQLVGSTQDHAWAEKASVLFRQEAAGLRHLGEHPQIPHLIDYVEQDGQQYLVQEFIDGQNLDQELTANGPFNEAQIRQLLDDLLPVLQFIHDRQIIHRDIKPANLIRRGSQLVLVDLGAAKYATGTALAKTGTVIGSAEFAAPEQVRGKARYASDLYSLGATCVHLLTQMSPFDLYDSGEGRWTWRDFLSQPVSPQLAAILDRLLQGATNRRYATAVAVLQDLAGDGTASVAMAAHPAGSSAGNTTLNPRLKSSRDQATGAIASQDWPAPDQTALPWKTVLGGSLVLITGQNLVHQRRPERRRQTSGRGDGRRPTGGHRTKARGDLSIGTWTLLWVGIGIGCLVVAVTWFGAANAGPRTLGAERSPTDSLTPTARPILPPGHSPPGH